jgi:hypothetical protein
MTQNSFHTDESDNNLEVTLKSGESHNRIKCSLLRVYSEQYGTCDAQALISTDEINGIKVKDRQIKPYEYLNFRDGKFRVWHIKNFKERLPPYPPEFIFCLKKQS